MVLASLRCVRVFSHMWSFYSCPFSVSWRDPSWGCVSQPRSSTNVSFAVGWTGRYWIPSTPAAEEEEIEQLLQNSCQPQQPSSCETLASLSCTQATRRSQRRQGNGRRRQIHHSSSSTTILLDPNRQSPSCRSKHCPLLFSAGTHFRCHCHDYDCDYDCDYSPSNQACSSSKV